MATPLHLGVPSYWVCTWFPADCLGQSECIESDQQVARQHVDAYSPVNKPDYQFAEGPPSAQIKLEGEVSKFR
jgi:hypothetical protein